MKEKKKLLAALIGTLAATAVYAQAPVTVYGQIDAYAGSRQLSGATRTSVLGDGGMSTSFFGFRGAEDLGGGIKANFDLAGFFNADTGISGRFPGSTDGLFARRAAVGLSGSLGRIDMGRGATPYFISMILLNPFVDSSGFSPIFLHTYTGGQFPISSPQLSAPDSGASNMIQYTTPMFGGFRATLQYALGEVAGDSSKNRLGGSLLYFHGPLALSFAFERDTTALGVLATLPDPEKRQTSCLAGATYNLRVVKLFGQVEQTRQEFNVAGTDRSTRTYQLGASIPTGAAGKVLVSWAHSSIDLPASGVSPYTVIPGFATPPAGVATSGVDPKRNTVTVGYDHNLSKRTDVYAMAMTDRYTGLSNGNSFAIGIRHRF